MNKRVFDKVRYVLVGALLAVGLVAPEAAAAEKTVAVVPFTVYAEKDLTFLQKGIVDMLTSRLSDPGKVAVVGREKTAAAAERIGGPLNPQKAASVGRELDADFVLFGSLTVFGESVSVDARMIDVEGERPPFSFFTQSASFGEVIPAVDRFAADINTEVFGKSIAQKSAPASEQPAQAVPRAEQPEIYSHPEKLIEGGFGDVSEQRRLSGKGFALTRPWKSRTFSEAINAMDLGDVDGDGKIETVLALPDKVLVYRSEAGRFYRTAEFEIPGSRSIVGVDIGDINGNDIPEIFISALNGQKNGVDSIVYEYKNEQYVPIVESASHYFRVVRGTVFGSRLYGQRQRLGGDPFSRPVFEMAWDGAGYTEGNRVLPSETTNLLGFTAGSPTQHQEQLYVAYSKGDQLQILEPSGSEMWESGDKLGGSTLHLKMAIDDRGMGENRGYLPMRIRLWDFDKDGVDEVLVAENREMANRRLQQFRNFTETQLIVFSWDGIGLAPVWKTRALSGHIRDLAVGDFDGDGSAELVAVLIQKEGRIVGITPKCSVIAYDIVRQSSKSGEGESQN